MRVSRFCLAALVCGRLWSAGSTEQKLIEEAVQVANTLPALDRAVVLLLIAENCRDISPVRSAQLADEVFDLASGLPGGTNSALEKNALIVMVRSRPARAVERYMTLKPDPSFKAEDVRADGAQPLFDVLFQQRGREAIPQLSKIANYLGDTGQYPFRAVGGIVARIMSSDPKTGENLLRTALKYFAKPSGYRSQVPDYADLVFQTWRLTPINLLREEVMKLQAAFSSLPADKAGSFFEMCFPDGCRRFESQLEMQMFRLSPLVSLVGNAPQAPVHPPDDPALVISVLRVNPISDADFAATIDEQRVTKLYDGVKRRLSQPPRTAFMFTDPRFRTKELQWLSPSEATLAARYAEKITNEGKRAWAHAALAPAYAAVDEKVARRWLAEAAATLDLLEVGDDKVRLGFVLSLALERFGEHKEALQRFLQSLDLGEEIYQLEVLGEVGMAGYVSDFVGYLCEACESMSRADRAGQLLSRIGRSRSPVLRAALLSSYARGRATAPESVGSNGPPLGHEGK
jgi:hypothetical protein